MTKQFDQTLEECIDRIALRGESVEDCLALYPDLAAELEPYLRGVARVHRAYAFPIRPEAKARGRQRLYTERERLKGKEAVPQGRMGWLSPLFGWQRRWATAIAAVAVVILLGGAGAVAASGGAMPDQPLYPVKSAVEQTRLLLTLDNEGKARLHASYAERRVEEVTAMAQKGKLDKVEDLTREIEGQLQSVAVLVGAPDRTKGGVTSLSQSSAESVTPALSGVEGPAPAPKIPPVGDQKEQRPAPALTTTAGAAPPAMPTPLPTPTPTPTPAPQPFLSAAPTPSPSPEGEIEAQKDGEREAKSSLKMTLKEQAKKNLEALKKAREKASPEARPAVDRAIEAAEKGYRKAIEALGK